MVAAELSKWVAYGPCRVTGIFGYNQQTDDRYVLFFETPTVANNDIPTSKGLNFPSKTSASYGTNAFGESLSLSELMIAISTTPQKLTAPGAGEGLELTIEVDTSYPVQSGITTLVGDLTTGVANKTIWSSVNGPKKLKKLEVTNNLGDDCYCCIQASDSILTTDSTAKTFFLQDGVTNTFFFGDGLSPYRKDADGTEHKGCTVFMDETSPTEINLPFVFNGSLDFYVRAIYE